MKSNPHDWHIRNNKTERGEEKGRLVDIWILGYSGGEEKTRGKPAVLTLSHCLSVKACCWVLYLSFDRCWHQPCPTHNAKCMIHNYSRLLSSVSCDTVHNVIKRGTGAFIVSVSWERAQNEMHARSKADILSIPMRYVNVTNNTYTVITLSESLSQMPDN